MCFRVNRNACNFLDNLASQRIKQTDILNFFIKQFNANCLALRIGGMDIDDFASNTISATP